MNRCKLPGIGGLLKQLKRRREGNVGSSMPKHDSKMRHGLTKWIKKDTN